MTTTTLVDSTGTIRRLQALAVLGWPATTLAAMLGCTQSYIAWLRGRAGRPVRATTAGRVAELFDQLAGTPGPSRRARFVALRAGWHGPDAWRDIDNPAERPATRRRPRVVPEDLDERAVA